jgi:hypothetical protein
MLLGNETRSNAIEGARWGLIMASLLSLWVGVLSIIQGSLTFVSSTGDRYYAPTIVGLYLLGGVIAGTMIGVLRGLLRWRAGAVLVGVLAAVPIAAVFLITVRGFAPWGTTETIFVVIFSSAFGGGGGLIVREFLRVGNT